jgi:hypothetical protein
MRSICFFSSYFKRSAVPYYVKFYLLELNRHYSQLVFITTDDKQISSVDKKWLDQNQIELMLVKNEGYDFGMWYKAFKRYDANSFDQIGLVNDSCILFKKLDPVFEWINKSEGDYFGLVDSSQVAHHIQSYFLVIKKKAIPFIIDHFNKNGILQNITDVIIKYEVGLSQYLINNSLVIKAMYSNMDQPGDYNPSFIKAHELILRGIPVIKRKVIRRLIGKRDLKNMVTKDFNPYPENYINLIKSLNKDQNLKNSEIDHIFKQSKMDVSLLRYFLFNYRLIKYRFNN